MTVGRNLKSTAKLSDDYVGKLYLTLICFKVRCEQWVFS